MKKTRRTFRTIGLLIALTGISLCLAGNSMAAPNTAANHIIRNTVTVSFDDAGGNAQTPVSDFIEVTVSLVESAPILSDPTDGTTDSATPYDYTYTLTSTANGPATYQLAVDLTTASAFISGSTTEFLQGGVAIVGPNQLPLGASTVASAVTLGGAVGNTTDITVPSDDLNTDSAVNGIAIGDFVVIQDTLFKVTNINDTNGGAFNATSTITVEGTGTANVNAIVTNLIAEQQTFTLRVTPGTVTDTTDQTIDVDISVDKALATEALDSTQTTVQVAALSVTKEVAVDADNNGIEDGPYAATANAAPGNTLIYRITVTNNGSANATNVVITDPLVAFTLYTNLSAKSSSISDSKYLAGTGLTDLSDSPVDEYEFTAGDVATYEVGTIPPDQTNNILNHRLLFFSVTVQ